MNTEFKKIIKIGLLAAVLVLAVKYFPQIISGISTVLHAASPLFVGFALAYILNLLMKALEKIYFPKSQKPGIKKSRRPACIILSLLILVCIITLIVNIVLPELISSFQLIGKEIPVFAKKAQKWLLAHSDKIPSLQKTIKNLNIDWPSILEKLFSVVTVGAGGVINSVFAVVSSTVGFIVNVFIGFVFSLYLLFNKERLLRQLDKVMQAWVKPEITEKILTVARTANSTFSSFIVGQCTEAVILGCLCTLGMIIFRFPYAAMTGTVVGVTALIPIVGAYIGVAVGAFMILTINPLQALLFVIFIVILQQFEGNLIYPRVVGTSIGLPGMWVLAAITVFGGLAGIAGMVISVPATATIYKLLRGSVNNRLAKTQPAAKQQHEQNQKQDQPL